MATNDSRSHLTAQQVLLERVMREVVERVQDAGFVLKGGGALVFAYGSPRHTTDLDFDADRKTDMRRRIRRAIQAAEVEIDEHTWWWPKVSRDSMRYKVQFIDHQGNPRRLQVDTRYRPKPKSSEVVTVNGIRTYKPEALYGQKLEAVRDRNEARDVFDLAFLSDKYGDALTEIQILQADTISGHMDGLERDLTHQIRDDPILSRITTAVDIVLEFRESIVTQLQQRGMKDAEQSVPISIQMTDEMIALRRLLHGDQTIIPKRIQLRNSAIRGGFDRREGGRSVQQPDWIAR